MTFLMNISSKSDVSPVGFIRILDFVHDLIQNEQKEFMQKIFKVSDIKFLLKHIFGYLELYETFMFNDERQSAFECPGMAC
jgi:hypothetical protein